MGGGGKAESGGPEVREGGIWQVLKLKVNIYILYVMHIHIHIHIQFILYAYYISFSMLMIKIYFVEYILCIGVGM